MRWPEGGMTNRDSVGNPDGSVDGTGRARDRGAGIFLTRRRRGAWPHELLAGPGEGPGDVSYVGAAFTLGQDRVLVADRDLSRVTVFADGSFARTVDIRRTNGLGVMGIGSSGQLPMATNSFMSGFEEDWLPGHMARFSLDTGALDTVASYDLLSRPPPGLRWSPIGAGGTVTVASGQLEGAADAIREAVTSPPPPAATHTESRRRSPEYTPPPP